jgi:hypothetical protein
MYSNVSHVFLQLKSVILRYSAGVSTITSPEQLFLKMLQLKNLLYVIIYGPQATLILVNVIFKVVGAP